MPATRLMVPPPALLAALMSAMSWATFVAVTEGVAGPGAGRMSIGPRVMRGDCACADAEGVLATAATLLPTTGVACVGAPAAFAAAFPSELRSLALPAR